MRRTYNSVSGLLVPEGVQLHWTPAIDNPCNEHLLGVIGNIGSNPINHAAKMIVSTPDNVPFCHIFLKRFEDFPQAAMEQLSLEVPELVVVNFLSGAYHLA